MSIIEPWTRSAADDPTGRTARFEQLYREMLPTVYRFTTARLGRDTGEEVAAEVFHAAVVAICDDREDQVTPAWLMAVARNKVIDQWRRAERRKARDLKIRPDESELVEFPADWAHHAKRDLVLDTLDQLKSRHRTLLVLHYVDGMSVPTLAEELGTTVSSLESALARARRAFRRHYTADAADAAEFVMDSPTGEDQSDLSKGGWA